MSSFIRKYAIVDGDIIIVEAELTDHDVEVYLKYNPDQQFLTDPSHTVPIIFLENSTYKREPMDFGNDPVVINL